jgi:curved DNA-binding protein CbpA
MALPDFYQILGVSSSASAEEIKSVHRELVKKYHPDLFPKSAEKARANKKLQQINEAYTTLSNEERRRRYDARLAQRSRTVKPAEASTQSRPATTSRRPSGVTNLEDLIRWANEHSPGVKRAYRDLSNTGRYYYADLSQKVRTTGRAAAAAAKSTSTAAICRLSASKALKKFAERWTRWISLKSTAGILGIMIFALVLKSVWKEPEAVITWTLLENTVVESPQSNSGERPGESAWSRLGYYASKSQCAESLKGRVAIDEREGSKVFLDERNGTIAMTIFVRNVDTLTEEYFQAKLKRTIPGAVDHQLLEQKAKEEAQEFVKRNGIIQRVNNYQCREIPVAGPDSWLRSKLKQLGVIS